DRIFGMMREAGLSRSTLNQAKSLYAPFFRWAKHRQIITRNPMLEFEMPTSSYVSHERTPPEVEELSLLLNEALVVIPDVAPVLALGAVTGMRRGELVGIRRSGSSGMRTGLPSTSPSRTRRSVSSASPESPADPAAAASRPKALSPSPRLADASAAATAGPSWPSSQPNAGKRRRRVASPSTSTARSSPCGSSHRAN